MRTDERGRGSRSTDADNVATEIRNGRRFDFGLNWQGFLADITEARIAASKAALSRMLGADGLQGKTFLDAGCGSGIHSLAAYLLDARVVSFDLDPRAVGCTVSLRDQACRTGMPWQVLEGSVLDAAFLKKLGTFDVVYSWGVLHHSGAMWDAIGQVSNQVAEGGLLFIAIYNDQGWLSRYWKSVKALYNRNEFLRWLMIGIHAPYLLLGRTFLRWLTGRIALDRGMSYWSDTKDWLGGLPFEVARPEEVHQFLRQRGFVLERLKTAGGRPGCNEFVFRRCP